jgi:molybdenum cofactor synthesis domain-containing protein
MSKARSSKAALKPNRTDGGGAKVVTACLIIIGNEILSGRTKDTNLNHLAVRLNAWGVRLTEARVIPDIEARIVAVVNDARGRFDYVFTTGGIGPTHDDITAAAIAKAFGVALVRDPRALAIMQRQHKAKDLNEARLKMADMPEGSTLIDNPVSGAPGFQIGNVFVMAGVPMIMQAMLEGLRHRLVGGAPVLSRAVRAFIAEGTVAQGLSALQARFGELDIGSYPFYRKGKFGVSLVLRGTDKDRLGEAVAELGDLIRSLGAEPIEEPAD